MIDVLGPSLAFWIISRAGQEVTPAEIQALIFMQGHSKGGSWLHPSALQVNTSDSRLPNRFVSNYRLPEATQEHHFVVVMFYFVFCQL